MLVTPDRSPQTYQASRLLDPADFDFFFDHETTEGVWGKWEEGEISRASTDIIRPRPRQRRVCVVWRQQAKSGTVAGFPTDRPVTQPVPPMPLSPPPAAAASAAGHSPA